LTEEIVKNPAKFLAWRVARIRERTLAPTMMRDVATELLALAVKAGQNADAARQADRHDLVPYYEAVAKWHNRQVELITTIADMEAELYANRFAPDAEQQALAANRRPKIDAMYTELDRLFDNRPARP